MKNSYYLLVPLILFSCQVHEDPDVVPSNDVQITDASAVHKEAFDSWMGQKDANARYALQEYRAENLVRVSDNNYSRWVIPKQGDLNTSMSFVFDPANNIDKAFISSTVKNTDNSLTSKFYTLENKLMLELVHKPDGSISVINRGIPETFGWWKEFEYCVGKVSSPFPSHVANLVTGVVFSAVTYGTWPGAVLLVCAGVATGRNYQN